MNGQKTARDGLLAAKLLQARTLGGRLPRKPLWWTAGPFRNINRNFRDTDPRGTTRAGSRPRQQCRPGPQGAEEKDAARGHFPRDEAPRTLRKALRKEGAGEGGTDPPRPKARRQTCPARRSAARQAEADAAYRCARSRSGRRQRSGPPAALTLRGPWLRPCGATRAACLFVPAT